MRRPRKGGGPHGVEQGAPRVELRFVSRRAVEALHREALAEHGGLDGIRDEGLLESALARCAHRAAYDPDASVACLAAALGFGLAKNHPFHDGNKRIALIASFLFVELNGFRMTATESEAYEVVDRLAAGEVDEAELAEWFSRRMRRGRSARRSAPKR